MRELNSVLIGKQIRNARKKAKLTQSELGLKIGRSKQWVSELERGHIRLTYESAVQISLACGITTDFFLFQKSTNHRLMFIKIFYRREEEK